MHGTSANPHSQARGLAPGCAAADRHQPARLSVRLWDEPTSYGWISIALHWATAVVVILLWLTGKTVASLAGSERSAMLDLHTSIGIGAYLLLWGRIAWRVRHRHPGRYAAQGPVAFAIGKYVHLSLLAGIGLMLVSGPLIVWSVGDTIALFGWMRIAAPATVAPGVGSTAHALHVTIAAWLGIGILLHLLGAYKHAAFNRDGTFSRMIAPRHGRLQPNEADEPGRASAIRKSR